MTTSFEQFVKMVKDLDIYVSDWSKNQRRKGFFISVDWTTGGMSGGDCWGHKATSFVSDEQPEELTDLDKILESVCPDISFLQYKNISRAVVENFSYTNNEYYGNVTNHAGKECDLKKLYNTLIEKNLLA